MKSGPLFHSQLRYWVTYLGSHFRVKTFKNENIWPTVKNNQLKEVLQYAYTNECEP
jgi:hypothetical protein